MAMRALSLIRKTCHIDSYTSSIKHSISSIASRYASTLMSSSSSDKSLGSGIPWRSLTTCSSGVGSIVGQSQYQSCLPLGCAQRSYSTSGGMVPNMRLRFQKQRRNRGDIKGAVDNHISFGKYGLETLEQAWITTKQITAGQLAIKRNMKGGKLFLRVFPHKPISLKPAETRMGRGKGGVAFWVASVKAGRILFEIDGVPESVARRAIAVAASKMPIKTRFVKSLG